MARQLRIEFPGACYYITSRGNEDKTIFRSKRDREKFLSYLQFSFQRYSVIIHAFCLMNNHYHLLIETPSGNISRIMQYINGAYTSYFNTTHRRSGHLFHGRFKSILIEKNHYADRISAHIHLNPVRIGIAGLPEKFPWSSYAYYVEGENSPKWLSVDFVLGYFSKKKSTAQKKYREYVNSIWEQKKSNPLDDINHSIILGGTDFVRGIRNKFILGKKTDRNVPALKNFLNRPDIRKISEMTDSIIGKDLKLAKHVKIHLSHRYSDMKLKEIGKFFHLSESGVSQTSRRVTKKIENDQTLKKQINRIKRRLDL